MRRVFGTPKISASTKKLARKNPIGSCWRDGESVPGDGPRDREVVELFKKLSGADPLPPR
jgi:hypothetical protein